MNVSKAHKIWTEQRDAAQTIEARFGLTAAFDYLVGEKLTNFAVTKHPSLTPPIGVKSTLYWHRLASEPQADLQHEIFPCHRFTLWVFR
jgi:hypothetical protein